MTIGWRTARTKLAQFRSLKISSKIRSDSVEFCCAQFATFPVNSQTDPAADNIPQSTTHSKKLQWIISWKFLREIWSRHDCRQWSFYHCVNALQTESYYYDDSIKNQQTHSIINSIEINTKTNSTVCNSSLYSVPSAPEPPSNHKNPTIPPCELNWDTLWTS